MEKVVKQFFMIMTVLAGLVLVSCEGKSVSAISASGTPAALQIAETQLAEASLTGALTVSCYESMTYRAFLEEAARLFEQAYPGTQVHVEAFGAMPEARTAETSNTVVSVVSVQNDPGARSDYITRVNTSLMSGEGADIYAMDILPIHKYAESGQFENLDAYIKSDTAFNMVDYRKNIIDASYYNGALYFMPMDYTFKFYAYDSTLVPETAAFGANSMFSTAQLIELAKPYYDGSSKLLSTYANLYGIVWRLWDEHYQTIVDIPNKKANFTDGTFASIFNNMQAWAAAGYLPQSAASGRGQEEMMRIGEQASDRYVFKVNDSFALMSMFTRGTSTNRLMMRVGGAAQGVEDDDELAGIQANENGLVPYTYSQAYGINANAKNKALAWVFIKFLMSEERQLSGANAPSSLPINNAARAKKADLLLSGALMGRGASELNDAQIAALANYRAVVESLSDKINGYVLHDTIIDDMLMSEATYYIEGSRTLDELARVLQNKVALYQNE
jgi:multiple sugar transport system substrate-binding protein